MGNQRDLQPSERKRGVRATAKTCEYGWVLHREWGVYDQMRLSKVGTY